MLCAAVISIVSGVPPDPGDQREIPGITIGSSTRGDATPVLRPHRQPARDRRSAAEGSGARERRDTRKPRGGAPAVAHDKARDGHEKEALAGPGPPSGDEAPDRLGMGPGGEDDDRPLPGAGARSGDADDAPRGRSAPGPASTSAPPPGADDSPADDSDPSPSVTRAAPVDDDDGTGAAGVATPAPGDDSDEAEAE